MMKPLPSRNKRADRRRAERTGRLAETLAAFYLRLKFYRILAQRFKSPAGEIDLIARRGDMLVFVEVKARGSSEKLGEALAAVNRERIVRAAMLFVARHPQWAQATIRFDVIFLAPFARPLHVRDAFDSETGRANQWR